VFSGRACGVCFSVAVGLAKQTNRNMKSSSGARDCDSFSKNVQYLHLTRIQALLGSSPEAGCTVAFVYKLNTTQQIDTAVSLRC
jgi:hypothetical protein